MIVPMKKVAIITLDKDADTSVEALRKLGVVHVEHVQPPKGEDINRLNEDISLVSHALDILPNVGANGRSPLRASSDWHFIARPWPDQILSQGRHVIDLHKRLEQLDEYAAVLAARIAQLEHWGDFDPKKIEELKKKDIFIRFYQVPARKIGLFPKAVFVKNIFASGGVVNCAAISQGEIEIPFKEAALPKAGLEELKARQAQDRQVMHAIKDELVKHTSYIFEFLKIKDSLNAQLGFRQAVRGMASEAGIAYLSGYVPEDKAAELAIEAKKEKWGLLVRAPSDSDEVPVLIRNPRWISLISPIFKFLEILPGYREFDISLPFLIFFSIFFGILIGDAGYGLVYLSITALIQRKTKKKDPAFFLFYILSLCAVVWGVLTGTFFGQEWVLKLGYKPLLPALTEEKGLQRFCFFLGALHLSIAHGWKAILKAPSRAAWGDLGWLCILWSAFFIARTLILGDAFPSFCKWLLMAGLALILIFTNPQKNILKSAEEWAAWLITLPFSFIGNFADVVSYIRLFAVGLAGVAIADAFNAMAAMIGTGNIFMFIFAAFVAFIGNLLGVVLGPVSVLVHGVRLNLLEFSGHMGLSWSGSPYKPLKE